jgi:hypothetical protein
MEVPLKEFFFSSLWRKRAKIIMEKKEKKIKNKGGETKKKKQIF